MRNQTSFSCKAQAHYQYANSPSTLFLTGRPGGFMEVAASLNLYRFNRIGSLHSVALGLEPKSSHYKYDALPIKLYDNGAHPVA